MFFKSRVKFKHIQIISFLVILILQFTSSILAQNQFKIDSIQAKYNSTKVVKERVNYLIDLSQIYLQTDINKSLVFAEKADSESAKSDNYLPKAHAKSNLAVVFMQSGSYSKAVELLLESRALIEANHDYVRLIGIELNLGAVKFHLEDYDGALSYFNKALELNEKLLSEGNEIYMSQIQIFYINIGSIYLEKKNYKAAITYMEKAREASQNANDWQNEAITVCNLGEIYLRLKDYRQAKQYVQESINIRKTHNDVFGIISSYNLLTQYYFENNILDSAHIVNNMAIKYCHDLDALGKLEKALLYRSQILENEGSYDKAVSAYKDYYSIKDSLINESVIEKTTRLQLEYNFKEIEQNRIEEQYKYRVTMYSVLALVVFLLIVFVLMFLLWKTRAKQTRIEKENLTKDLELKNRELTTNVMYLLKKHELINSISTRLMNLKSKLSIDNKNVIQKIIFDLQAGAEPEVWEEFELRFQNVHSDFYEKLHKVAPDLTPSELKLCAFLRLNMNSKEISALIHQSTKSIEVKRSRIRKKLGITNTEANLVKYLTDL